MAFWSFQRDSRPSISWVSIKRDAILLVTPQPHAGERQRRVHRQRRRVRARVGFGEEDLRRRFG